MCTCCTAPVAATLRRDGVSTAAALAHWLGNPLLNPAVLVFLAFVAPWQWTLTRIVVGVLVVVGGSALVARLTARRELPVRQVAPDAEAADLFAQAAERFARTLARLLLTLVPEYLLVVLALGAFRGWLFPIGGSALGTGAAVVVVAAVVGTLLVIPTGGEVPILRALALAGLSLGTVGALLLTLPAASLPAMAMVGRALGWRTTWATAATVAAGGLVAGACSWRSPPDRRPPEGAPAVVTLLRESGRPNHGESRRRAGTAQLVTDQTHVYHPGQIVPTSGIYRCAGGDRDHVLESTDVKGHRFPPLPAGCTGIGWILERAAGHR